MLRVKVNSPQGPAAGKPRARGAGTVSAARTQRAICSGSRGGTERQAALPDEYRGEQTCLSVATSPQFSKGKQSWADGHSRLCVMQLLGAGGEGVLVLTKREEPRTLGVRSAAWGGGPGISRERTQLVGRDTGIATVRVFGDRI